MQPSSHNTNEFGELRIGQREAQMSRAGDTGNLEPKAIAVLGEMVAHPGHLLARDDLLDTVWGHRHVTPSTLNRIVTMLRQALGDEPTAPRYIETVPRMGYRFIAEVHATDSDDAQGRREGDALFRPQPL